MINAVEFSVKNELWASFEWKNRDRGALFLSDSNEGKFDESWSAIQNHPVFDVNEVHAFTAGAFFPDEASYRAYDSN